MAEKKTEVKKTSNSVPKKARGSVELSGNSVETFDSGIFHASRSKYDVELDALWAIYKAAEDPGKAGGKIYTDPKAVTMLKNRAMDRKIHLQVGKHPKGGIAVRIDPDQSKSFEKKVRKAKKEDSTVVPPVTREEVLAPDYSEV